MTFDTNGIEFLAPFFFPPWLTGCFWNSNTDFIIDSLDPCLIQLWRFIIVEQRLAVIDIAGDYAAAEAGAGVRRAVAVSRGDATGAAGGDDQGDESVRAGADGAESGVEHAALVSG